MNFATATQVLGKITGNTVMGLDTETPVKLTGGKKNPMQGRVTKRMVNAVVRVYGDVLSNGYENKVNNALMNKDGVEPTFKVGERSWGDNVEGTGFVEHNGNYYLKCVFETAGEVEYRLDGKPIDKEAIIGFPPPPKVNPNGQGGLSEENRIHYRTFKIENIVEIRAFGMAWR